MAKVQIVCCRENIIEVENDEPQEGECNVCRYYPSGHQCSHCGMTLCDYHNQLSMGACLH